MNGTIFLIYIRTPWSPTSRSIVTFSLLRIIWLIGIHHQDTTLLFTTTHGVWFIICATIVAHIRIQHYMKIYSVPSTTNSSNQLHLTLVPATKFSARACIKLLFSTLSCISIFVPNVFNHYTSKNRHQSFTFPPLITFILPLIVNRIPAGIGWFVLPAFLYVINYLSVFFPLYPPALIARFPPPLLNLSLY